MSNNNGSSGGIGFTGFLALLFIGLKLTHYIDWDWIWVLSPLWIPVAIIAAIALVAGLVWIVATMVDKFQKMKLEAWRESERMRQFSAQQKEIEDIPVTRRMPSQGMDPDTEQIIENYFKDSKDENGQWKK